MGILIFALIVIILVAMVCYAVDYLPLKPPFNRLIQALVIIVGVFIIAQRAGIA